VSATRSGYETWPILVGLMGSSIVTGALISRTGRYKRVLLGSMVLLVVGNLLLTRLTAGTNDFVLWAFMLLVGVGVGPSMAGFTVVVQTVVPRTRMGVATSTLTFVRQIGGSVGLAIAGTIFTSTFTRVLPTRLVDAGVPSGMAGRIAGGAGGNLTGVGNVGSQLGTSLPPIIVAHIVTGIHDAVASAVADLFWLGAAAGALAFLTATTLREVPLHGVTAPIGGAEASRARRAGGPAAASPGRVSPAE
jgi:MFS family permease